MRGLFDSMEVENKNKNGYESPCMRGLLDWIEIENENKNGYKSPCMRGLLDWIEIQNKTKNGYKSPCVRRSLAWCKNLKTESTLPSSTQCFSRSWWRMRYHAMDFTADKNRAQLFSATLEFTPGQKRVGKPWNVGWTVFGLAWSLRRTKISTAGSD
jgi:hypothetical protein